MPISIKWRQESGIICPRISAILVDFIALIFIDACVSAACIIAVGGLDPSTWQYQLIPFIAQGWLLFAFCAHGSVRRATIGLRGAKLMLRARDGGNISGVRAFCRLFTGLILSPLFPATWCAILVTPHRSLADRICGTIVVRFEPVPPGRGFEVVPEKRGD